MELEFFDALRSAGVPDDKARKAAESLTSEIKNVIDKRYSVHAAQLVTRGDLAETKADIRVDLANFKAEIIKWVAGMFVAQTAFILTAIGVLLKLFH